MHVWSTRTMAAFTWNESRQMLMWRTEVTELMFKSDFVLDIAFALTSVHLATEEIDPTLRATHVSRALEYQNRAFVPFSSCLENLSPKNCSAVFAFTALNMACSLVAGQLATDDRIQINTPWQSILTLYDGVIAMNEILQHNPSWLIGTSFSQIHSFMQGDMPVEPTDFRRPWTSSEVDQIRTAIRRLRGLTGQVAVEKHPIYSKAIAMLDHNYTQSTQYSVGWLAECGPAFFEDVRKEEPLALMILMHWGVLLNGMEAIWWAQYSGARLVQHLSSILPYRGSGQEWASAILWCRNQVAAEMPQSQQYPHEVLQCQWSGTQL